MASAKRKQGGGLLVDWSTALSLAATTAMVAVPGLRTFVHEAQRSAVVNTLQLEIRKAAQAANELGQTVTMCASNARADGCAEDGNWSRGWIAFVDVDNSGAMEAGEAQLRLWSTSNGHANIAVASVPAALSFRPFYARPYGGATPGRVAVCDREGAGGARGIEVDRAGVPRLAEASAREGGCRARR